ncbi:unnamed protein product [Moneuplotes crassus]|uniref:Uncharacterized protein n=1 Tax=Euplotes crassus TaxID=5936 RepID=A0AAD1U9D9_EUPCR|nr:unnamed protein product [Moneuplotes crassus]
MSLSPPQKEFPNLKIRKSKRLKEIDVQKWIKKRISNRKVSDNESTLMNDESSVEDLRSWRTKSKESIQTKTSLNQSKEFKQTSNGKVEIETFKMEIKTYLNCTHKKLMFADLSKMKNGDEEYLQSLKSKMQSRRGVLSPGVYRPSKLLKLEKRKYSKDSITSGSPKICSPIYSTNIQQRKELLCKKNPNIKKFFPAKKVFQKRDHFSNQARSPQVGKYQKQKRFFKDNNGFFKNLKFKKVNPTSKRLNQFQVESLKKEFEGGIKTPKKIGSKIPDKRMKSYLKAILPELPTDREEKAKQRPNIVVEEN